MAIKTGTLRRKFSESLERHILCRNSLLMTLAAMKGNSVYSKEDREKVARIPLENGSSAEDILKIVPQIERDYCPTNAQVKNVMEVISGKYTYKTDYIANKFLRTVNQEDLGVIETKKSWKRNGEGLKRYIFERELVEELLTEIGCEHIKYHHNKEYWSCSNPDGDNPCAVIVKNAPYLGVRNYTRKDEFSDESDIISLVEYSIGRNYNEAYDYICEVLGINSDLLPKMKEKRVKYPKTDVVKPEERTMAVLDEKQLQSYVPLLYIGWFREGIMPWTRDKFGILYSYTKRRIIIPIRNYETGELVATNERTTVENFEELGIKKYVLTEGYQKHLNIYGLYENRKSILEKGYVVVYEAEKSVLKRDSLNDPTGVAIGGHSLSDRQAEILLGLNVDIVISMDNDITTKYIGEVLYMCEKLYNKNGRNVYYTIDNHGILGEKDSIADLSRKDYDMIFSERVLYDETEHNKLSELIQRKKIEFEM